MKYKFLPRVKDEDRKKYSKVHLFISNNWWDGITLSSPVNKKAIYFKCLIYALAEVTKDKEHPIQRDLFDWVKSNREYLKERIGQRFIHDYKDKYDEETFQKKYELICYRATHYANTLLSHVAETIIYAGIVTKKIRKVPDGYCNIYSLTKNGKALVNYVRMGYLL